MTRLLPALLLLLVFQTPARAQTGDIRAGDRLRIRSPAISGPVTVDSVAARGTLVVQDSSGRVVLVPIASVTDLSVRRPRTLGEGALRGMGVGFASGAAAGILMGIVAGDDPPGWASFTMEEKAAGYGAVLGGAGGIVGVLFGLSLPGEQWHKLDLQDTRVGPSSDGGVTIGRVIHVGEPW